METISSASSALSKRLLKLSPRTDATILVAGSQKMLSDVLAATGGGAAPATLLLPACELGARASPHPLLRKHATHLAAAPVLRRLCGLATLDAERLGLFGALELAAPAPAPLAQLAAAQRLLVLDGVSDPGNVGALLRTAYGLGWGGVVTLPGTAGATTAKVRARRPQTCAAPAVTPAANALLK